MEKENTRNTALGNLADDGEYWSYEQINSNAERRQEFDG